RTSKPVPSGRCVNVTPSTGIATEAGAMPLQRNRKSTSARHPRQGAGAELRTIVSTPERSRCASTHAPDVTAPVTDPRPLEWLRISPIYGISYGLRDQPLRGGETPAVPR